MVWINRWLVISVSEWKQCAGLVNKQSLHPNLAGQFLSSILRPESNACARRLRIGLSISNNRNWSGFRFASDQSIAFGRHVDCSDGRANEIFERSLFCFCLQCKDTTDFSWDLRFLSQTCHWCRSDNSPPVMKIPLVGLVILRFNKPNMKLSHWWRRGKLNLSPPVTRIIPPKPHL